MSILSLVHSHPSLWVSPVDLIAGTSSRSICKQSRKGHTWV